MADTITVKFKVLEDGSLQAIGKNADKAAAGLDKATKSSDKYSKRNKGVAGATSNSTKAFSKMTTGIEGSLVPAYATLAANVFAVTAAFGALRRASAADQLKEGLLFTGRAAGQNLTMIAEGLREITGAAVSSTEAMSAVAIGISAGFDQSQLEGLARVAKGASLALGRDMTDAMDRLIRGAAKLEPEILDELGIMVRLDKATSDYAKTLGKTSATELTQFERRMAFTNAIIEQGSNKFLALSNHMKANPFDKLAASFKNLSEDGINFLNNVLGPIASFFADNVMALVSAMTLFGTGVAKQMLPALTGQAEAAKEAAEAQKILANEEVAGLAKTKGRTKAARTLIRAIEKGEHTTEMFEDALKAEATQLKRNTTLLNNGKITQDQFNQRKEEGAAETARYAAALSAEEAARVSGTQVEALALIQGGEMRKGLKLGLEGLKEESEEKKKSRKNTKGLTRAKRKLGDAVNIGTKRMRLFGAAALRAIPIIGQIAMAASLAKAAFDKLFGKKPKFLDKALEDNKRRIKEFPEITRQLAETFQIVTDKNEQFILSLRSSVGLLSQIKQGVADIRSAEEADNITKLAEAQLKYEKALARKEAPKEDTQVIVKSTGITGAPTIYNQTAEDQQKFADKQFEKARKALEAAQKQYGITSRSAVQSAMVMVQEGIINLQQQRTIALQAGNDEALEMYDQEIKTLETAKKKFGEAIDPIKGTATVANFKELQAAIEKSQAAAASTKEALDGVGDATSKITEETNKYAATSGAFAGDRDAIDKVLKLTENLTVGKATLNKKYAAALDLYKAEASEAAKAAAQKARDDKDELKAEKIIFDSRRKALVQIKKDMEKVADDKKKEQKLDQEAVNKAARLAELGKEEEARQVLMKRLKDVLSNKEFALTLQKQLGRDAVKEELELLKQQAAIRQKTLADYNQRAGDALGAGMGNAAAASIRGQGAVKNAKDVYDKALKDAGNDESDPAVVSAKKALDMAEMERARGVLKGVAEDLKAIGPEGAYMGAAISGIMNFSDAFANASETMADSSASLAAKAQAGLGVVQSILGAMSQMQKAATADKLRAIDQEIAAEEARDGKSAASVQKLASLNKKKGMEERKAFEKEKQMKIAQTYISTAQGAISAYTSLAMIPIVGPALGAAAAAAVISMGMKQVEMIKSTTFAGGGGAGSPPSKISVGSRQSTVDLAKGENAGGELAYARGEQGTGTGMTNFKPAFAGYKHRAAGGFVVGEQGPEVFMPDVPGEIIPSGKGAGAGPANVNFSISAVDSAGVEDLLMNQRGNIIGMIREAANEHGEMFLESVQEKSY